MDYPFWDVGISYGILMAAIAVPHVFVSHFAIGGGLYLVVAERAARRRQDPDQLEFLRRLSRFFVLTTLVFGALTGVGIWFVIGLLNPSATEALIRNFVWAWATEWTFFLVEILAAILYYYGWKGLSPRVHLALGWIYFAAAWLSLFVINGILTFMLTPGDWLASGDFWDGFFNPTFWPSLVLRTGICLTLAGLYALMVASLYPSSPFKVRLVRSNARWGLLGLAVAVPSFAWYRGNLPLEVLDSLTARLSIPATSLTLLVGLVAALATGFLVFAFAWPRAARLSLALVLMVLGLGSMGALEWFRESARKPYAIAGFMYGNRARVDRVQQYATEGLLPHLRYRTGEDGADLFRAACRSCHTLDGYNALRPAYDGTDPSFIAGTIRGLHMMRALMPRFPGTAEEAEVLARWIHARVDQRPLPEVYGLDGLELGRRVYQVRCGICHVQGGHKDKTSSLAGLEAADYQDLLKETAWVEEMPAFSGSEMEAEALVEYLLTWKEADQ